MSWNPQGDPILVKVASGQAISVTSGVFQNITALLPPALQTYLVTTVAHVSDAFAGPSEFLESRGASPTAVYSTLAGAAAISLPLIMARYWSRSREALSPYASIDTPHITNDDFSYITSEDLENPLQAPEPAYDPHGRRAPRSAAVEEDDVILIKHEAVTYPVHFPAYSIGDGRLTVGDVRDRTRVVMDLNTRQASRIKMYYKGRALKEQDIPIRDYGVKNNSELLVVLPGAASPDEDDESSGTAEEVVVADPKYDPRAVKKRKNKNGKKKPKNRGPREPTANLEVPGQGDSDSKWTSPDPSLHPSRISSPAVPSGALEKLKAIRSHFDSALLPLCREFLRHPPRDPKKLEEEHRKLSETAMQQVVLKLDEIETGGDLEIRARRKDLVNYVQAVLKEMDDLVPEGAKPNR